MSARANAPWRPRAVTGLGYLGRVALLGLVATLLVPKCSLGQGTGGVAGTLDAPECWSGCFDLHPDFFAAMPTSGSALQIRVQNGADYETFSDGVVFLVDDLGAVRGDPLPDGTPRPGLLEQTLTIDLSPSVTPPGVPIRAIANPSIVHASLYLERTCRTLNVGLYAMACSLRQAGAVALCGDAGIGGISGLASDADAGANVLPDASALVPDGGAAPSSAISTITFHHLFDGDLSESNAQERLTDADFDLYLADPREIAPGGLGPPPPCRGHLQGRFHFYFQRGRPAQPFP